MNSFVDNALLSIYNIMFYIMDGINSVFFPDGWIKFITIPLVILLPTYYIITSFELDKEKSYITQLFQTFMMVFTVYIGILIWSFWMKELALGAFDRKEIALQLENPLIKKEIIINGKKLENNSLKLIYSLTRIRDNSKQGSRPLGEIINIEIKSNKKILKLQVITDNKILNDYWVFFFREEENKYSYIGHIKTDYFTGS